jgi:hypothetical protein
MATDAREKIAEYDALLQMRRQWEPTWDRIARLVLPRKSGLSFSNRQPGLKVENQYTSTAIRANELLASSIQGALTSSVVRWFALVNGVESLKKNKAVALWYEAFSDRLYQNLVRSNFNQEMQEVYLDLGAFGTGAIFMTEQRSTGPGLAGFQFQAQEIGTYVIAEDDEGHVDTFYRILKLSPVAIIKRWGAGKAGKHVNTLAGNADTKYKPIDVLHGIYPRAGAKGYTPTTRANKMPVASCYIVYEDAHIVEESGFPEMPAFVPRWTKVSGETYGRGQGFTALGDISTLDEATKLNLQAWAFSIRPPIVRRFGATVGSPKIVPGVFLDVYDMEALRPLESGHNAQHDQIQRELIQNDIRNAFFWEQLQLPNQQLYTAYEVQKRLELMQRVLGPTLGRLEVEAHQRIVRRGAAIMLRAGQKSNWQDPNGAPEPPQEILEAFAQDMVETDIQYLGPLSRAQKAGEIDSLNAALQTVGQVATLQPDSAITLNGEKIIRFVFEKRGLTADLTRSEDEVKQAMDEITAQRQQQAQQESMANMASTAKDAAGAVGSMPPEVMDMAAQQAQGAAA